MGPLRRHRAPPPQYTPTLPPTHRCHRRTIADPLARRGWRVIHILDAGRAQPHKLRDPGPELPFGEPPSGP